MFSCVCSASAVSWLRVCCVVPACPFRVRCVVIGSALCVCFVATARLARVHCVVAVWWLCGGCVVAVCLLSVRRAAAVYLPCVCYVSAVWQPCVRCVLSASFPRAHGVLAARLLYVFHGRRPTPPAAPRSPQAASGFRRIHLRWPSPSLLGRYW